MTSACFIIPLRFFSVRIHWKTVDEYETGSTLLFLSIIIIDIESI